LKLDRKNGTDPSEFDTPEFIIDNSLMSKTRKRKESCEGCTVVSEMEMLSLI